MHVSFLKNWKIVVSFLGSSSSITSYLSLVFSLLWLNSNISVKTYYLTFYLNNVLLIVVYSPSHIKVKLFFSILNTFKFSLSSDLFYTWITINRYWLEKPADAELKEWPTPLSLTFWGSLSSPMNPSMIKWMYYWAPVINY